MLRFGRVVFGFRQLKQGTRTRREQEKLAEENSPVECFRRRGNERSEAIGAAAPDRSPLQLMTKAKPGTFLRHISADTVSEILDRRILKRYLSVLL